MGISVENAINPDPNKQANEVYFSRESSAGLHLPVDLNNSPVQLCESNKHLRIVKHLNFHEHIAKKIKICNDWHNQTLIFSPSTQIRTNDL